MAIDLIICFGLFFCGNQNRQPLCNKLIEEPTPLSTPIPLETQNPIIRYEVIENSNLNSCADYLDIQQSIYVSTIDRMESNMNIVLFLVSIISVLIAIFGFRFIKTAINDAVNEKILKEMQGEIDNQVSKKIQEHYKEWDEKYAHLYDEVVQIRDNAKGK